MDEKPRNNMLFVSLCTGYLVSFAVPRLGEISRCLMLKKSDGVPFNKSLISIVIERTVDLLTLLILLVFAVFSCNAETALFFRENIYGPLKNQSDYVAYGFYAVIVIMILVIFT